MAAMKDDNSNNTQALTVADRRLSGTDPAATQTWIRCPARKELQPSKVKAVKAQPSEERGQSVRAQLEQELSKMGQDREAVAATSPPDGARFEPIPEQNDFAGALAPPGLATGIDSVRIAGIINARLPLAAIKVRNVKGKVLNLAADIISNKVIIQGVVQEQLYFVGTDGIIHHLADEAPFVTFIDLPGVRPGMNAQVTAVIEEILTELAPDGLNIVKKIIIAIFVKVTETVQVGLLPGTGPLLLLDRVIGEETTQTILENDLILAAPTLKVDEVAGTIRDLTTEVINDKVVIQGILHSQIFLIDAAHRGGHQAEDLPFSVFLDLPGAAPGMAAQVRTRLEGLFFELIAPTVLRQKAVVQFLVKVTETTRLMAAQGAGPLFKTTAWVNENTVRDLRETTVTLPVAAVKIRELNTQIREITTQIVVNKAIVQGVIHQQILFIDTDNLERHQAEELPFVVFLDLPGVNPDDQVQIISSVEGSFFHLETPTQLQLKAIVAITTVVSRELQLNLVLGPGPLMVLEQVVSEGTKQVLVVRREVINQPPPPPPLMVPTIVSEKTIVDPGSMLEAGQQIVLRNQVTLPVRALSVKEINGAIVDSRYWVSAAGVIVEGAVSKDVAVVGMDHVVRRISERVPFVIMVPVPGIDPERPVEVSVLLENIAFELTPNGMMIKQTLVLQATVAEETPTLTTTLVIDVSGPGVLQTKIRVSELVLLPDGRVERQEFDVVTSVAGPAIVGVERATVVLNVIENGAVNRRPVEVVTGVIISEL